METFRNENMVSEMEEKSDNTVPERESDVITSEVEGKENENTVSYRKTKNDESELKCECETEDNAILETKPNVVDNMVSVLEEIYIENPVPAEIKQKCDVVDASDMENLMIVAEKLRMIGDEVNNIYETEPARRSLSKMKIRLKDSCFSIMTAMPEVAPDKLDTNIPTLKQNSTQPVESGAKEEKPRSRYKKQTRKTYYYHLPKTWNSKKDMTKSTPLASKGFSSKPKSGRSERHIPLHLDQKKIATKSTDEPLPISEDFDMTKQYDLKSIKESFHVSGSSILAFDSKADSELGYESDYESDPEDNLQINKGIFYQPSKAIQNVSDVKYKTQSVPVSWKLKQILASPKRLTRNVTSTKPQAKAVAEHKGPTKTDDGTEGLTLSVTESEFSKPNATCNEDVLQDFSDSGLVLESAHAQACGYPVVVDGAPFVTNDVTKFTAAVKGNGKDLEAFAALFQINDFDVEHFPINPLLIVAVFGSPEAIEYTHKFSSSTFNWNQPIEIKPGVLEGVLDEMKDRRATPLYVATFLRRLPTVIALIQYADEDNLANCMHRIQLDNSMERVYMAEVAERLKIEYSKLKPGVVPGHKKEIDGTWGRVYVVYSADIIRPSDLEREGIGLVMLRNPYIVDGEAVSVSQNRDAGLGISKQELERTKTVIKSNSKTLWCNHSNLNIISVSSVRSKRKGTVLERSLCIVLYCSTKGVIPLGENEFPRKLNIGENDSISVDVREGYFVFGGYATGPSTCYHDQLKMGCNIGKMTTQLQNGGGTLGPFVQYDGRLSFLTCAHVLFDISQSKHVDFTENVINRVDVVQPAIGSSSPSGDPCGFVQRAIFDPRTTKDISIDVAVVAISDTTRLPTKGRFAIDQTYKYKTTGFDELPEYNNAAYIPDVSSYGSSNMVVQFGCETHLTKGYLVVDGAHVRPLSTALGLPNSADKLCMNNQYEVKDRESAFSFFRPGDSGAAVFMMEGTNLHCIGMSIGCTSYGTGVVTPIGALLDDLNFPPHVCSIAKFDDQ